jgi:hypothetical protein
MVRFTSGLLLAFSVLGGSAFASSGDISKSLIGALTCKGEPMDTVTELAMVGNTRSAEGFVGYQFGEEMDTISGVALTKSLKLGAAQTHNVVASIMNFHEGFGAFVFAQFEGDYKPIVAEYKLSRSKPGESFKHALDVKGPDEVCPMTIELLPQEDGHFLFGCSWCNG